MGNTGSRVQSLESAIGCKPISSEVMGAIQRQVFDNPGLPLETLLGRLQRRFNRADVEGAITSMSRVKCSPVLVRDEHDRIWPFVGGEE